MGTISAIEERISPVRLIDSRPGSLLVAIVARRRLQHVAETVDRALADPRVRREVRRAAAHTSRAMRRARHIGARQAVDDRCVAREVHRARGHLARAADLAAHPTRSHRVRNVALASAALVAAGAAYAGTRPVAPQPELVIEETDVVVTEVVI